MGNKIHLWRLMLCIGVLAALGSIAGAAYQQGNMLFEAQGWTIFDQYSNRQAFEKDGLFLDVRASTGRFINATEFAADLDGKVESEKTSPHYEAVIVAKDIFYIFVRLPYQDKTYVLTMSGNPAQMNEGKTEMKKIVDSVSFSPESKVVEAAWEKPLTPPEELPLLTRYPIPWGWIIFLAIVGLFVWWRIERHKKKKHKKHTHEKESREK